VSSFGGYCCTKNSNGCIKIIKVEDFFWLFLGLISYQSLA